MGALLCAVGMSCGDLGSQRDAATTASHGTHLLAGKHAKVLAPSTVRGWTVVGRKSARGVVALHVKLRSRKFTAFAVRLNAPALIHLTMYGIVSCASNDGGGRATSVRYSGLAPVVLKLDSAGCSHEFPPSLDVKAQAEKAAKDLALTAEFLRR